MQPDTEAWTQSQEDTSTSEMAPFRRSRFRKCPGSAFKSIHAGESRGEGRTAGRPVTLLLLVCARPAKQRSHLIGLGMKLNALRDAVTEN